VLPFALASLVTASNSYRFSNRIGRATVLAGIASMFAGLPGGCLAGQLSQSSS
jgi:hypothetical protein